MVLAEASSTNQPQRTGSSSSDRATRREHRRRTPGAAQPLLAAQITTARQQTSQTAARVSANSALALRPGFAHDRTLVLGVIQLLSGVASIILATVAIASMAWGYFVGAGIWTGVFFISSGIMGIVCAKKKDNCTIIAFLVLSIISAVVALILVGFSAAGIVVDFMHETHLQNSQVMVVHSLILVIAFIQGICAIVSSTICCKAVCCNGLPPPATPPPYDYPYRPNDGQQIAIFQPNSSRASGGSIFSLPHGAYIIQPAEHGNNQILYMLPAPGPETIHHSLPPPPYYSRENLDDDDNSSNGRHRRSSNIPPSPAPPYSSRPDVREINITNSLNSHNTSQGSIQIVISEANITLDSPNTETENLEMLVPAQESDETMPCISATQEDEDKP